MPALRSARIRLLLTLGGALLLVDAAARVAIAIRADRFRESLPLLPYGTWLDLWVAVLELAPLAAILALSNGGLLRRARVRRALVTAVVGASIFGAFVELFFFDEFDSRFNHVALDYLLFPSEVAGNIWESYPVPLYLALALLGGSLAAATCDRWLRSAELPPLGVRRRAGALAGVLLIAGVASIALAWTPPLRGADRRLDEIGSNGLVQLVRAFHTATLDYESNYLTVSEEERERLVTEECGWTDGNRPDRAFPAVERRPEPLDVVVVLSESFGSEFVGALGGRKPNAPGLERWAKESLFLTNVMATGNRTVRGLEGVLCSLPPLPGDSIWKRQVSGVATIGSVLGRKGYRTEFVYGGDGRFDRMRSFAVENGWDAFLDDALLGESCYPADAFRTIWGVADETLFAELLARQRQARADGVRFFGTALTVSNHKPFLTPDSKDVSLRAGELRGMLPPAALLAAVSAASWSLLPRRTRRTLGVALAVVWGISGTVAWMSVQPKDSRDAAVRYADRAFAEYLDQAKAEGFLDHTVVLFVGDHGARVYGSEEIPAASYRVPAMFVAPDAKYHGATISRLCSQIDLAPTLLSLAGIDFTAPFFGQDLLREPADGPGRAYLIHNRDIGELTDTILVVLGIQRTTTGYRRANRGSDTFELARRDPPSETLSHAAAAVFQSASGLIEAGRFRLSDAP